MDMKSLIDKARTEMMEKEFSREFYLETIDSRIYITCRNDISDIDDFLGYVKVATVVKVYSSESDGGFTWLPTFPIIAVLERKDGEYIRHEVKGGSECD